MKALRLINILEYEATKTCGRYMTYELYHDLNVLFPYPFWVYQLLTDKYMFDIEMAIQKRRQAYSDMNKPRHNQTKGENGNEEVS